MTASWRQVDCIRYLDQKVGMINLPAALRETAEIRGKYPDASLQELGTLFNPPLSKSAVNHRLRKLEAMAFQLGFREVGVESHE